MRKRLKEILTFALTLSVLVGVGWAQQSTGGIQGVLRDQTGSILPGVDVTVTEIRTGRSIQAVTNDSGLYVLRSLTAGPYDVRATLQGFKTKVVRINVEVGSLANGDITLDVGQPSDVITVSTQALAVDTASDTVAGTVTSDEIKQMPLNGRNFLDLAQTEPGIQLVDGGNFDPTKNQFTGVSVGGRSGRVTRITVDGIDISDETVGTTVQNISVDSVQEFQVSQSSLDPSTSITSSGAVNIITRSGSNDFHGSGFIFYRDEEVAALPTTRTGDAQTIRNLEGAEFDREQGGFEFGGPFIKDRLFFFLNYEKLNQDGTTFTSVPNFANFNSAVTTPFNDNMGTGRLDWNITDQARAFFRFTTETNDAATGFGGVDLAPFVNQNVTNVTATGVDVSTARLTHSFRYGHTSFDNEISTNNLGLPEFKAANGVPVSATAGGARSVFQFGPSRLAPQATYQTTDQFKYDGAWVIGNHTLRYGTEVAYIQDNLFASFFGVGPEARLSFSTDIQAQIAARGGDPANPLEYPVNFVILGNGQGAFTEIANQGRSAGGINNTRIAWYVADSWRMTPSLNLNMGVRYELDTGQVNDDLPLPQEFSTLLGADGVRPTRLDKNNFGPQAGFAWQPFGTGRTVIRGGAGIFYETQIFNNTIFDRLARLPEGLGFATRVDTTTYSGQPLKNVIDQIGQAQLDFQAEAAATPFDPNGTPLILAALGTDCCGPIFTQDFSSPYGIQMNIGVQHQIRPDWVVSVDFVRNRNVHHNIVRNFNLNHAASNFDATGAQARVNQVLADNGYASMDEAIAGGMGFADFSMSDFFGTVDPRFGNVSVIMTSGISNYRALQIRSHGRFGNPMPGIRNLFLNLSYSLSRFDGMSSDQDFLPSLQFQNNYFDSRNIGPSGLDRTHSLSAQIFFDAPGGFRLNFNHRWATALPGNLVVPESVGGAEEIFYTDFDGDGERNNNTINDFLPNSSRGDFGRRLNSVGAINRVLSEYNSNMAGKLTPAAQQLVAAGLFTEAQLKTLGVVTPTIPLAPANQVFNDSFITSDLRISRAINIAGERVKIEPAVEIFNLFNIANFDTLAPLTRDILLSGTSGAANGTIPANRTNLLGLGSGSFSQGIPRSLQFALRVSF